MSRRGTECAKFKRLRRLWCIVPVGRQGRGEARAARPYARVIRQEPVGVAAVKRWWLWAAPRGSKRGQGRGQICARFVSKTALDGQLDSQLGVHWRIGAHPHTYKIGDENRHFKAIRPPLIPKTNPLN